jgi:hypothetical protein
VTRENAVNSFANRELVQTVLSMSGTVEVRRLYSVNCSLSTL